MVTSTDEVVFVYLGKSLPNYAKASLHLSKQMSGMKIHLLGNRILKNDLPLKLFKFTAIEDFYDSKPFQNAAKNLWFDHSFRDGFWLKTLERFFVLEKYMQSNKIKCIFHAELDQLLFRTDRLVAKLNSVDNKGIYLPFHSESSAVASIFYCNDQKSLKSLINFSMRDKIYKNEMELIAAWSKLNSTKVFALPTMGSIVNSKSNSIKTLSLNDIGGVVDAAQLGQWVAGVDPFLVPIRYLPRNKFVANKLSSNFLLSSNQITKLIFNFDKISNILICNYKQYTSINIYNLHLHSKIHKYLLKPNFSVTRLISIANESESRVLPGTRRRQILEQIKMKTFFIVKNPEKVKRVVIRNLYSLFGQRPSSYPFITSDTFRKWADHRIEEKQRFSEDSIKTNDVIYVDLKHSAVSRLDFLLDLKVSVNLVIVNSDLEYSKLLINKLQTFPRRHKYFIQNCPQVWHNIQFLPYGLKNKSTANGKLDLIPLTNIINLPNRINRIFWDFEIDEQFPQTLESAEILYTCDIADNFDFKAFKYRKKHLMRYKFVACPVNQVLDTSEFWEAIYSGCIPIVLKSNFSEIYSYFSLPVWEIDSYTDIVNLKASDLETQYNKIKSKFNSKELWADYWFDRIKSIGMHNKES